MDQSDKENFLKPKIEFNWLIEMRWLNLAGYTIAILFSWKFLGINNWELLLLLFLVGLVFTNIGLYWLQKHHNSNSPALIGTIFLLDTALLTFLLLTTGGPSSPFSILYLMQITLAAIVLGAKWAWITAIAASTCYAFLYFIHLPVQSMHHSAHLDSHLQGMWIAFVATAISLAYFISKIKAALKTSEQKLQSHFLDQLKQERLASLTTLEAGAAHELGTPLSTIAVVAGELD